MRVMSAFKTHMRSRLCEVVFTFFWKAISMFEALWPWSTPDWIIALRWECVRRAYLASWRTFVDKMQQQYQPTGEE